MLILALLLAQATVRVEQNNAFKGNASTFNYTGAGINCSVSGRKATCNAPGGGGGGGSPGGSSGNVQINSAGSFGAYTGTTCSYAVKSLDASGAATCTAAPTIPTPAGSASELQIRATGTTFGAYTGTGACAAGSFMTSLDAFGAKTCAAPTIPADVSGASYWTRVAEPGLSNETALGALGTGIILNTTTTGVPTIYGGTSCTNQFPRSLNASGAATCAGVALTDLTATGTPSATTFLRGDNTWATPAGGGGAPTTATYITQTPDATLSAEQALSALGTGLVKNTTGTGVLSIAAPGTDYQAPLTLPLSLANGGTNTNLTAAAGAVVYSTATAHAHTAVGTAGQVLTSQGTGTPTWTTPAGGSGPAKLCGFDFTSSVATSGAVTCTAARAFYCLVNVTGYGGSDMVSFRFNADATATNYHARWINFSNATPTPTVSAVNFTTGGNIQLGPTGIVNGRSILVSCSNFATKRKICTIQEQEEATSQATFAQMSMGYGEWFNTAAQITSIEMRTNGGQTITAGSGFVCYGGTPP